MILLSYTTLNDLINEPHTYLCKVMGLQKFTTPQMNEGKEAHRIIQAHISDIKFDERLGMITEHFPIVEEKDQDEKTHFTYPINDTYAIHGYIDGINLENKRFLEIKTSSTPWSIQKFNKLIQWKIYALSGDFEEVVFITCTRDIRKVAKYSIKITTDHIQEALDFINKGIAILESGDFSYKGQGKSKYCNYIGCPFCGS